MIRNIFVSVIAQRLTAIATVVALVAATLISINVSAESACASAKKTPQTSVAPKPETPAVSDQAAATVARKTDGVLTDARPTQDLSKTLKDTETPVSDAKEAPKSATSPSAFAVPWTSVNGGGGPMVGATYRANTSIGQSAIGFSTSGGFKHGSGYWYGTQSGGGCSCPFQSDFDEDNFLTALDLGAMIDILFAGQPDVQDASCPSPRADFDCDDFSTALDLGGLIDHLFAGGPGPCDPCTP